MDHLIANSGLQFIKREIEFDDFKKNIADLKDKINDRALLRAMHFYKENDRVDTAVDALEKNDFDLFLEQITASGLSSFMYNSTPIAFLF